MSRRARVRDNVHLVGFGKACVPSLRRGLAASVWAFACGFDPAGLGGGIDAPLAESGGSSSTTLAGTTVTGAAEGLTATGPALETTTDAGTTWTSTSSTTSGSSGEAGAASSSAGDDASGDPQTTEAAASSGATGPASMSASEDTTEPGSSSASSGGDVSTGDTTGSDPCEAVAPIEGVLFAEDAVLDGYTLEPSDLLADFQGEPVLYARAEGLGRGRSITYSFEVTCPTQLVVWGLVYPGSYVGTSFNLALETDPAAASVRWNFECLDEEGWSWVPVAVREDACLDAPVTFDVPSGEHRLVFTALGADTSVMVAMAYSSDAAFDPHAIYTP